MKKYITILVLCLSIFAGEYVEMGRIAGGLVSEELADQMVMDIAQRLGADEQALGTIIVAAPEDGPEYAAIWQTRAPEWGAGLAIPGRDLVIIKSGKGDIRRILKHELTHVISHRMAETPLPRWFDEGLAERFSRKWSLDDNFKMSWLVLSGMPELSRLETLYRRNQYAAYNLYGYSYLAVNTFAEDFGERAIGEVLRQSKRHRSFGRAFEIVTGEPLYDWEVGFQNRIYKRYGWVNFIFNSNLLWYAILILFLIGGGIKIWRTRMLMREERKQPQDDIEAEVIDFPEEGSF